ncbi:uncharacterized protein LOC116842018 [Odontomachus brunneus]|uniref:uncharacterized protein LOC116842018 n=1 Tax=Odontomachus brunneus TaxID=486640 RepID=UPI0013F1CE3F|nr:uncharacterized protein LOC116842018 [Odontomachus brunneus]XP_032666535.1 uncharacterized protein LOC116842018 [Odontomachus brunneus]
MLPKLLALLWAAIPIALSQSNYASQGNSIEYQPGLPPSTVLDGKVTKLDDISSIIFLNRTKANLNCGQGSMEVDLKFEEPFYGVAYADFDRNSACIFKGRGATTAKLELPLKGCGTKQDPLRVFTNNVVVRFHPGLEMDGDEVITIVCRYPPPVAPIPPAPPASISATMAPAPVTEPPLKGFQILLIICAILFLSLLLLGLGCSYMCLKRRNVRVVHRHPFESGTGSEITKLSGSSLSNITMFEGLKIPRAHALLHAAAASTSGSEANLVIDHSDTLPSDYPSESHSEVDEERSLPVSSAGSYDNKAFVHEVQHQRQVDMRTSSSLYSETVAAEVETSSMTAANASRIMVPRHPVAVPIEPKFDVQMRVKRAPPPPPSPLPSESDVASVALERNLTTILEREESSLTRSLETAPYRMTTFSYVPELHGPPGGASSISTISRQQTPPVYSRILRKQAERETTVIQDKLSSPVSEQPPLQHHEIRRPRSLTSLNTELTETRSLTEVTDASHAKYRVASILAPTPPPPPPIAPTTSSTTTHTAIQHREHRLLRDEMTEPLVEPQVVAPRRPEITTHEVDDVFLRTVTEKKTIEDVERHCRQVTEYRARAQPPPDLKWDVTIRNYPTEDLPPPPPEWENFSDVSSASNLTITNEPTNHLTDTVMDDEPDVNIEPTYTTRAEIPCRPPPSATRRSLDDSDADWYTRLARVLEPRYASELTDEERAKWREIITTESTLRTLLTEAVVKEDYELIRKDARYVNLFPPAKWDVIIRILGPPSAHTGSTSSSSHGKNHGQRYKRSKSSEWDNRSRRSSLPTLYEYESDGGSSARTLGNQSHHLQASQSATTVTAQSVGRSRRFAGSIHSRGAGGAGSEADLRSMSEMTVRDFARVDRDDLTSLSSFEGADSLVRSLSQPSLARSGSEFTEHWGMPSGIMDLPQWATEHDGTSSVETTPRAIRRGDRLEVLASFDEHRRAGLGPSIARSSRYSERELSVRVTESQRASDWFHDNNSEPEMQI